MKNYIIPFGNFCLSESVGPEQSLRNKLRLLKLGVSEEPISYSTVTVDWTVIDRPDIYIRDFITLTRFDDWIGTAGKMSRFACGVDEVPGFDPGLYGSGKDGLGEEEVMKRHLDNIEVIFNFCKQVARNFRSDILKIIWTGTFSGTVEYSIAQLEFPVGEQWFLNGGNTGWVETEPLRREEFLAEPVDWGSSLLESEEAGVGAGQSLVNSLKLSKLGVTDYAVKVAKVTVRWENVGLKNEFTGGSLPFINWRLIERFPADLDQPVSEQDTWVDFAEYIPGFEEAYGREGDTEIVDQFLLDEAWEHGAQVLWIANDNDWRFVKTGQFLPDLRKI